MKQGFISSFPVSVVVFALCTAALAVAACSPGGLGSREILRVNGEPVYESDFLDELEYQASFWEIVTLLDGEKASLSEHITEDQLKSQILTDELIPMALVKAEYKDKIPSLMEEAEKIKEKLDPGGANFAEIASAYSKDNAEDGGALGNISRRGYAYPVPRMAFEAEAGEIVGPFLSIVGCHILYVQDKVKGTVPAVDTVRISHILLPYEEDCPDFIVGVLGKLKEKARIEVLDPEYEAYLKPKSE